MTNRMMLGLSAAFTACVLVIVGALVAISTFASAPDAAQSTPLPVATDSTLAYQQALAEANAKLEQANRQIEAANTRLAQPPAASAPATSGVALSAEQAAGIASQAAGGAQPSGAAQLVRLQGQLAYEVPFDQGKVYVDARSGQVLASTMASAAGGQGAQPSDITQDQAEQIALATYSGQVWRTELEEEDGQQLYEVRFADGVAVYVDAASGQVLGIGGEHEGRRGAGEREHQDD
ncbi:PepSY domain-containing protein [Chloroflexia bacterium SDU3-3]|nr:PepSY domain-containing protein [Chloroflexia bacterium SDU3-3]